MAQVGTNLASGSRVSIEYAREQTRNVTPAGINTPVTLISASATPNVTGYTTGYSSFLRGSGSFITDGFIEGQTIRASGFVSPALTNNDDFVIAAVTALEIVVVDAGAAIQDATAATVQQVQIMTKKLRTTGRNLNLEKNTLESEEVDADGQITDVRHGFNRVVGSPGYQLSLYDYDDFIEFFLNGTWTSVTASGANFAVDGTLNRFTRISGNFINDGFRPGDIIRTTNFATANNGDWTVSEVGALYLEVIEPAGATLVTEGSGPANIVLAGQRMDLTPGVFTFLTQRSFGDIAQYQVFNGCSVNTMQMTVSPEAIINGSFNILGMSAAALSGTPLHNGETAVEASGSTPFAAFDGAIYEGGALVAVVTSMEFTMERNRTLNPVVGSKFSPDMFEGTARGTGTVSAYFDGDDPSLFNKFVNETESSVWNKFQDPADSTNFISIVFPRVKYTGANMDPPQEGPIVMEMPFQPLKATGLANPGSTTVNTMMTIQRSNS